MRCSRSASSSAGQARYYLDQGEARVDAVDSIGDGVEEYYAGGAEARGAWLGSAARRSASRGRSTATRCGACSPASIRATARRCASSSSPVKVAGFDLTFSAPKSVSVLFGIGDRELRGAVRAAHDRAAREAVGYLGALGGGGPARPWRR